MDRRRGGRFFWGLILIAVGMIFLSQQLGWTRELNIGELFATYWPIFLIFFGLKGIFAQTRYRYGWGGSYVWNLFVVLLGAAFLAKNLDLLGYISYADMFRFISPALLIIVGVAMLFRPNRRDWKQEHDGRDPHKYRYEYQFPPHPDSFKKSASETSQEAGFQQDAEEQDGSRKRRRSYERYETDAYGTEHRSGFFGDLYLGNDAWELKPMNISHFIGDTVLDLTKAHIPHGETRLQISAFIGDVKVFIPGDMEVEVSVLSNSFLGDITVFDRRESGFMKSLNIHSAKYAEADKRIRLIANMFIGDVKVLRVG